MLLCIVFAQDRCRFSQRKHKHKHKHKANAKGSREGGEVRQNVERRRRCNENKEGVEGKVTEEAKREGEG